MSQIFGPTRQIGLVVNDFWQAIEHWTQVQGVGPFFYFTDAEVQDYRYHGQPAPAPVLSIAMAYSGDTQIEIIHQQNNAPSIYRDFIDAGREGIHHISGFSDAAGFDCVCQQAAQAGLSKTCEGNIGNTRFAYFNTDQYPGATICEISESMKDGPREIFEMMQRAAKDWDGKEPVRLLGGI